MAGVTELTPRKLERGERNNNPLSVRWDGRTMWKGINRKTPSDRDRKVHGVWGFIIFEDVVWGFRAAARVLWNYQKLHGLDTIERLVARWAPPEDRNHTEAYIRLVERETGVARDARLDLRNRGLLVSIMAAMIRMECGRNIYDAAVIREGVDRAGIPAMAA